MMGVGPNFYTPWPERSLEFLPGVDEENYGLPTMRIYAGNIPSGTYTVVANLYDNAAMRYYYGFTAADQKRSTLMCWAVRPVHSSVSTTLARSFTILDGNFNLYFRDADYLSGV